MAQGRIRVGVGGWVFEPWRESFYPKEITQKRELEYMSRTLTSIEINGTYYGSQKPASFTKWHDETPDDFVFTLKGPRFATNRKVLAEAAPSIEKFITSGIVNLKHKLGPINWQFMGTKKFDPADFEAFLKLLPKSHEGLALRHAVEVRHDSFATPEAVALLGQYGVAPILAGDSKFPVIADATADFVYMRLMGTTDAHDAGYGANEIAQWMDRAKTYASGNVPEDLPTFAPAAKNEPRDVFVYVISGEKPRNPLAAQALIAALG
jgi:uncharacterized protein YecE (DUF72 family)